MFNSKLIKEAHKMAKEIKTEFPNVSYKFQFGLCVSYLLEGEKMVEVELVAITEGTEKQIAWATEIRNTSIKNMERELADFIRRGGFEIIVAKIEKGIVELKTTEKSAKFWIEHKNLDGAYLQKIKRQK